MNQLRDSLPVPPQALACLVAAFLLTTVALAPNVALAQGQAPARFAVPPGDHVLTLTEPLVGAVGGVAVDRLGDIYVADFRETVYKITPDGSVSVFATGIYGASGNNIDSRGNLVQANFSGNSITRIDRHGNQVTLADEGLAGPVGIAVDPEDNLFVVNCRGNYVARVSNTGAVTRFAESDLFNCPNGITLATDGNFYVVNYSDERVLRIAADGTTSEFVTLPGGGNGHIAAARGQLFATSFQGQRVYSISLDGTVELLAGTGNVGTADGPALEATFSWPNGIASNPAGDRLYVNDFINRSPPNLPIPPSPRTTVRVIKLATLSDKMQAALQNGGVAAMQAAHDAWKANSTTGAVYTEVELNIFGYGLLNGGQADAALEVFRLNTVDYPNSWNAWDSLGEGYMKAGRSTEAIAAYERSLELNPGNTNGADMLARLRSGGS